MKWREKQRRRDEKKECFKMERREKHQRSFLALVLSMLVKRTTSSLPQSILVLATAIIVCSTMVMSIRDKEAISGFPTFQPHPKPRRDSGASYDVPDRRLRTSGDERTTRQFQKGETASSEELKDEDSNSDGVERGGEAPADSSSEFHSSAPVSSQELKQVMLQQHLLRQGAAPTATDAYPNETATFLQVKQHFLFHGQRGGGGIDLTPTSKEDIEDIPNCLFYAQNMGSCIPETVSSPCRACRAKQYSGRYGTAMCPGMLSFPRHLMGLYHWRITPNKISKSKVFIDELVCIVEKSEFSHLGPAMEEPPAAPPTFWQRLFGSGQAAFLPLQKAMSVAMLLSIGSFFLTWKVL